MSRVLACTAEDFARAVAEHRMSVLRADGVNRHLRFRKPGTNVYWFDLITWPGTLCIDGDCGTYVFRRLEDMFEFFRSGGEYINPPYWAEKCISAARKQVTDFNWGTFEQEVRTYLDQWCDGRDAEVCESVRAEVLEELAAVEQDEFGAVAFIRDFQSGPFHFSNWEASCREYTFHFIWCLRAIVWGIYQWDASMVKDGTHG